MNKIRITDLAKPVLSEVEQQLVDSAPEVTLSVDAVLRTASERTGLKDFGAEDFKERLGLWLRYVDEDRGLNRFGRQARIQPDKRRPQPLHQHHVALGVPSERAVRAQRFV